MKIVQKFGGTSVSDISKIKSVAEKVKSEIDDGHSVVVVVSAMAGMTNKLSGYCKQFNKNLSLREYDVRVYIVI